MTNMVAILRQLMTLGEPELLLGEALGKRHYDEVMLLHDLINNHFSHEVLITGCYENYDRLVFVIKLSKPSEAKEFDSLSNITLSALSGKSYTVSIDASIDVTSRSISFVGR